MLDQFLLSRAQVKEASVQEDRLVGELGLGHMSLEQLQKLAMMDGGGPPPGGPMPGVAGAPGAPPAPPAPPGMGPPAGAGGDGTSTTAAEDIGAAVGAAMKVIKDKEQQQAEAQAAAQQAEAEAQQAEAEAQAQAAQEQAMMEEQALAAQSPQPNLPPTFPPGQEPQAPPGAPPAGAPAAGGGPPPAGGPPGGMPPKQAFAYMMKHALSKELKARAREEAGRRRDELAKLKTHEAPKQQRLAAHKAHARRNRQVERFAGNAPKGRMAAGAADARAFERSQGITKAPKKAPVPVKPAAATSGAGAAAKGAPVARSAFGRAARYGAGGAAIGGLGYGAYRLGKHMQKNAEHGWVDRQQGAIRAMRAGNRGFSQFVNDPELAGNSLVRQMAYGGGGALGGAALGGLLGGRRGAGAGMILGGVGGMIGGHESALGKHLAAKGIKRKYLGMDHEFSPEAAKRYLPSDEDWGSSKKAFALAMRS